MESPITVTTPMPEVVTIRPLSEATLQELKRTGHIPDAAVSGGVGGGGNNSAISNNEGPGTVWVIVGAAALCAVVAAFGILVARKRRADMGIAMTSQLSAAFAAAEDDEMANVDSDLTHN